MRGGRPGGDLGGEPRALLEGALPADPAHQKSLLLLAAADFRQGRVAQAQARWQALLQVAPQDSRAHAIASESLARVGGTAAAQEAKATPAAEAAGEQQRP